MCRRRRQPEGHATDMCGPHPSDDDHRPAIHLSTIDYNTNTYIYIYIQCVFVCPENET